MKKLCLLPFLFLITSCGLFGAIDYGPAIQANKGQAIIYEELRMAFAAVIMGSKDATTEQKAKALSDINSNRNDFQNFNRSLEQFLIIVGEIDPERLLQFAKESYEYIKAREDGN